MVSYKPLVSISEEEVSLLLQKQNLPAIPSLPVSSMIQAPPFIFFSSKPLPFPYYCRLLPRFNSLPSQSQKQNNPFCSSPPPAALLLFQISTHQLFLWFSYKSIQPFLESITKSRGDLRSLTWPPSSIWMAGHLVPITVLSACPSTFDHQSGFSGRLFLRSAHRRWCLPWHFLSCLLF